MKSFSYDLIIPSYNGLNLLKKHLPSVLSFSKNVSKVIIVDDGSTDGTESYLAEKFPHISCLHHDRNLGFTKSVNLGFKNASSQLVVLLNNDVSPLKNYLDHVFTHFEKPDVFAVTLNEIHSSWPQVSWQGKLQYVQGEDKTNPHYSAWASGGSAVFRRDLWNELHGFDEVYSPGYWEDIDLGWRAWKAGYRIIWEPKAKVEHLHESTFALIDKNFVNLIKQRNELLFNWKNITDSDYRQAHIRYLFRYCSSHPGYLKVVLSALSKLPRLESTPSKISDRQVLSLVNQPL